MINLVTLFNVNYIDKALVMYESLEKVTDDFILYVILFDRDSYEVLKRYNASKMILITQEEFETPEILEIKNTRTNREYLWTCSSLALKYVFDRFNPDSCTYIDADLFFYSSPQILLDEIIEANADVGIMLHGFIDDPENERYLTNSGKYCVEFNYFKNNENGRRVLDWWAQRCIECCSESVDGVSFGDQKYVEEFADKFEGIHVFNNRGGGVAPWNLSKFRLKAGQDEGKGPVLIQSYPDGMGCSKDDIEMVFYHFQQISYISINEFDIHANMYPYRIDNRLQNEIYAPYLKRIISIRRNLKEDYSIDMWSSTVFTKRESFFSFVKCLICYERNIYLFFRVLFRWIFRRNKDYITISD